MFIAHIREKDREQQPLETHLIEVAEIAKSLSSKIGLPSAGELIGLMHDFGKYSQSFQQYIGSATGLIDGDDEEYVDANLLKGKIDHSTAGAQFIWRVLKQYGKNGQGELCGQMLSLCIASHHSGLIDCLSADGTPRFFERMDKDDEKTHLRECSSNADHLVLVHANRLTSVSLIKEMLQIITPFLLDDKNNEKVNAFNLGFLTKFLFSCLIDADRLNSAEFESPSRKYQRLKSTGIPNWSEPIERLESFLGSKEVKFPIDILRKEISDNCKRRSVEKQGIYTLTVPTGGGKTYASLRYALHHAKEHNLDRIIYVIPYTSIIEQNAQAIRNVIEREDDSMPWVLEHHSNLEPEQQTWRSKLVSENWDSPIVLTTMVQFLETLFSGGTRGVRRLHQLANSVLIFDEIQTLPINCTHLFCNAINFLTQYTKTTAVLCTATQPLLNKLKNFQKGQLDIPPENELVADKHKLFDDLRRVNIINQCKVGGWSGQEIAALAINEHQEKGSCLVIVNTKAWAKDLYQLCESQVDADAIYHLSTGQYPEHRRELLKKIRDRLTNDLPVLCFSTQLIEAGVDVDFASVIRFLAGLDSIAQAAGRCNRNGKRSVSTVTVVNPDQETIDLLKDIKIGQEKAIRVFGEAKDGDMLSPDKMDRYFQYYFYDRSNDMDYPLKGKDLVREDSLLNLLSDNDKNIGRGRFVSRSNKLPLMAQSFMEAGKAFKAIDAPTHSVIIRHGEGKELVNQLCAVTKEFNASEYYRLLKKAQKYSVNVFPNVWNVLKEQGAVYETQEGEGIFYLDERYYSDAFGLSTEPVALADFYNC
jgi:CRISPR-associated endonuclease/helicase Cas3